MQTPTRRTLLAFLALSPMACSRRDAARPQAAAPAEVSRLIDHYARAYDVPATLVHRVVQRESGYNPAARNGPYYGLMQILPQTAATMGYRGAPEGLLDAETNLRYGVKYLRGAWLVARGNPDRAVMWYTKGYYYEAKRMGLLEETGLRA
ncbi:MAG: transglycosylase SLT domain-containing protein [Albidovulum sp.]